MSETEDEIDLVDLLAVLLKWRVSIFKMVVLSATATALILFAAPLAGLVSFDKYQVRAVALPVLLPPALKNELAMEPIRGAQVFATDSREVAAALEASGYVEDIYRDTGRNGWAYQSFIKDDFIGKAYRVEIEGAFLSFKIDTKKPENAKLFLERIVEHTEARLRTTIASKSALIARSMEDLYKNTEDIPMLSDSVKQLIISSNVYAKGQFNALELTFEPQIYIVKQGRSMMFIVAVMASFFASILIVFIAEALMNMRNDPVASEKIVSAMKARPSILKAFFPFKKEH